MRRFFFHEPHEKHERIKMFVLFVLFVEENPPYFFKSAI